MAYLKQQVKSYGPNPALILSRNLQALISSAKSSFNFQSICTQTVAYMLKFIIIMANSSIVIYREKQ